VAKRLSKCLFECVWEMEENDPSRRYFKALHAAATLAKCLNCGLWNTSDYVSKQFERVGVAYSTSLGKAGFTSLAKIASADPRALEMVLKKPPPFGNHIRNCALAMPFYNLQVENVLAVFHYKAVWLFLRL